MDRQGMLLLAAGGILLFLCFLRKKKPEPLEGKDAKNPADLQQKLLEILRDAMPKEVVLSYSFGDRMDGNTLLEGSFFVFVKTLRGTFGKQVIISPNAGDYVLETKEQRFFLTICDSCGKGQEETDKSLQEASNDRPEEKNEVPLDKDFSPLVWLHKEEIREKLMQLMPSEAHRKFTIPASLLPKDKDLWQSFAKEKYACGFDEVTIEEDGIRVEIAG
jgi:hypothetical protein